METTVLKDAYVFLCELPSQSVDLVVSSPPYFIGKEYDSSREVEDFVALHEKLSSQLVRVVKPGGSICWQVGSHVRENIVVPLDALVYSVFSKSKEIHLRNRMIWTFGHGEHARRRFSGRHETILWFTKGADYAFNLDAVRVPQKYPGKKHYRGPKQGEPSGNPLGKNPGDVWEIPNVKAGHVEKTDHPCQFPVALVQRLVKALCPMDGLVIDPYMGAGSTGVAAISEGRQFAGCDIEARYIKIARARIKALQAGTLKIRPLDRPIHVPSANDAVAQIPPAWRARANIALAASR
ncbi:MAG TPA: site-specific DNA-methyltransferase [Rhizomicrobium sp.]|jgi:adenine-specific DNA-methyltransferase|nr:site-specific DNA-methyltransferase [Rhizomicrobium sp.]